MKSTASIKISDKFIDMKELVLLLHFWKKAPFTARTIPSKLANPLLQVEVIKQLTSGEYLQTDKFHGLCEYVGLHLVDNPEEYGYLPKLDAVRLSYEFEVLEEIEPLCKYTHFQDMASSTWRINHNLNRLTMITVFSKGTGEPVSPNILNPTLNQTILEFCHPFSGKALIIG